MIDIQKMADQIKSEEEWNRKAKKEMEKYLRKI